MGWSEGCLPAHKSNRPPVRPVPHRNLGRPAFQLFCIFFPPAVRLPAREQFYGHAPILTTEDTADTEKTEVDSIDFLPGFLLGVLCVLCGSKKVGARFRQFSP
jgi:hypothetical protein